MKLSPIILSAAVCASGQYLYAQDSSRRLEQQHQQESRVPAAFKHRDRSELSTEYFLQVPLSNRRRDQQQQHSQIASVVSVPAPNLGRKPGQLPAGVSPPRQQSTANADGPQQQQTLLRSQPWALPLVALSAAAMLLMAAFEIFVLLKARAAAPSRRHLFLGQALLLGLFLLAGLSAAASLTANPISCAAFRLVGLPAALVFAALLVKCVFLLSLNSGVYLPAPYQALVLVFAVLVQVAIVGQWLYGEPSSVIGNARIGTSCRTPLAQSLAALGYPGALLLAVTCLAIRARGVRDNYRESWFIGLAVGLVLPLWLGAGVGSLLAGEAEREAWLSFGLLGTSILVFLAMFLPKGRQLAALGREAHHSAGGHVIASRHQRHCADDQLSSLPDCAANYSPSFFHYKPAPPPAALATASRRTMDQRALPLAGHHHHAATAQSSLKRKQHYHSQDRVALVASAANVTACSACRHSASPVYSDATSASNFDHMPYIHGPMETFVLPPGMYLRPEDTGNLYTTLSANPNVFFQRAHPGMMY